MRALKSNKEIIQMSISGLIDKAKWIEDPNEEIDRNIENEAVLSKIHWYPTYLIKSDNKYFMFITFSYDNYLEDEEIMIEIKEINTLVQILKSVGIDSKIFFIINNIQDRNKLSELLKDEIFGILDNSSDIPLLILNSELAKKRDFRLLPSVIGYLSNVKNLTGEVSKKIQRFAKEYNKLRNKDEELKLIRKFIKGLLECDKRYKLKTDSIDFMSEFEKFIQDQDEYIRDHFFHALNTLLIGYMIIDKNYDTFSKLAKYIGNDINIEFLWLLIALYHDIGYPVKKEQILLKSTYGIDDDETNEICKQNRIHVWEGETYQFIVNVLNDFFKHIDSNQRKEWRYDAFPRNHTHGKFIEGLRKSFIEIAAHGAASSIRLGLLMSDYIRNVTKSIDREFLYRNVLYASLSILFHDKDVRDCLIKISLKNLSAKKFAFSLLLSYVDILQEDKRDITGIFNRPDIFKDVDYRNGDIIAILDDISLSETIKKNLRNQLESMLSFFIMNGISFAIPEELINE